MANYRTMISNTRKSKPPKASKKRPTSTIAHRYSELQRLREMLKAESRSSAR